MIVLQLAFIFYYIFVLFVFYKLHENACSCKKMEVFKKTWNFYYVVIVSSILLLYNIKTFIYMLQQIQSGGNPKTVYYYTLLFLNIGFGSSFLNDYAIIDLLQTMKHQKCPCHPKKRNYLNVATYLKLIVNAMIYLGIMTTIDSKQVNRILRQIKKRNIS